MPVKPIGERIEEMKRIYTELDRLGLGPQFEEIKEFQRVCNGYVRSGLSVSGSINIPSLNRRLVYDFPSSPHHRCVARLTAL